MNEQKARARLIAALPGFHPWGDVVDLLLPVVREIAAEEAAEALRTAANSFDTEGEFIEVALGGAAYVVAELRRDADQLTKPPDGPVR